VESATHETDDVPITEAPLELLSGGRDGWDERPPIPLKGKSEPVRLFAPRGPKAAEPRLAGAAAVDTG
jgi:class 3 adenylate cyclase